MPCSIFGIISTYLVENSAQKRPVWSITLNHSRNSKTSAHSGSKLVLRFLHVSAENIHITEYIWVAYRFGRMTYIQQNKLKIEGKLHMRKRWLVKYVNSLSAVDITTENIEMNHSNTFKKAFWDKKGHFKKNIQLLSTFNQTHCQIKYTVRVGAHLLCIVLQRPLS